MANADTEVTLQALHEAIAAAVQAQFPAFQTVEFYRDDRAPPALPACLLEMSEMEPGGDSPDPGTGQLAMTARFEARLIVPFTMPNFRLEARKLAAAVALWLYQNRHLVGVRTGPAYIIGCYQDHFAPDLEQYEVWRVEWRYAIHLGSSVWGDEGTTPTEVLASFSPAIGTAHEAEYTALDL